MEGRPEILNALEKLKREYFFVSVISHLEFLLGARSKKEEVEIKKKLNELVPLDLRRETVSEAVEVFKKNSKKLKFKDLLIAATAKNEKLTLITADKDFKTVKGLKVKLLKLSGR